MLRRKKTNSIEITKLSSLVAENVEITGDLAFSDGLRVDGSVCGNLSNKEGRKGLLVLSERGRIEGNVRVHDAVINGEIVGDVQWFLARLLDYDASIRPDPVDVWRSFVAFADVTRGKYFKGTPENIDEVFKEISTFF